MTDIEKNFKERLSNSFLEMNTLSLEEVFNKIKGDEYLIPEYQRENVWDKKKESLLIESLIMNLPLPPIFLFQRGKKEEIVDGQQRLKAIERFMNLDLDLNKLEVLKELKNKKFDELPELIQTFIKSRTIKFVKVLVDPNNNNLEIEKIIFERLNTGGVKLEKQEIRNAIYQGNLNTLIKEISELNIFKKMFEIKKEKMKDREIILKILAKKDGKKITNKALDKYMEDNIEVSKDSLKIKKIKFKDSLMLIKKELGEDFFLRENKKLLKAQVIMNIFMNSDFTKGISSEIKNILEKDDLIKENESNQEQDIDKIIKRIEEEIKKVEKDV